MKRQKCSKYQGITVQNCQVDPCLKCNVQCIFEFIDGIGFVGKRDRIMVTAKQMLKEKHFKFAKKLAKLEQTRPVL